MEWKNRKLILSFRILAMFDVLFSKRFELKTYRKSKVLGILSVKSSTNFDYDEIKNAKL